jgi:hypothetical protein
MSDDEDKKMKLIKLPEVKDPAEREMEVLTEALSDPWRRSTIELGITTNHVVNDHGPSMAMILLAKHVGLMLRTYLPADALEEGFETIMNEIREEMNIYDA